MVYPKKVKIVLSVIDHFVVFLVSMSHVSALIFVISYLLLTLGLGFFVFCFFLVPLSVKLGGLRFFNVGMNYYEFPLLEQLLLDLRFGILNFYFP